jgi:hypothetical protein
MLFDIPSWDNTKLGYITSTWYTCPEKSTNFEVRSEVPT